MNAPKKSAKQHQTHGDDIVLDAENGEEFVSEEGEMSLTALKQKLKKVRDELAATRKESMEHLTGWQRAKADLANFRRIVEEDKERDGARARAKLVRQLIPSLDAFDAAMADQKWAEVDKGWREGMERVAAQFHKALAAEGLDAYGTAGEMFDPTLHECMSMQPTEDEKADHTIAQVLQKGYRIGSEVVRPAKVVVYQHAS